MKEVAPEMVDLAVIGAGYWGTKLIYEYIALSKKRQDVNLVAIADTCPERLKEVGSNFSFPDRMLKKNYKEILDNPQIVGIHIATPNKTHYEIAREAVSAGKHVLLEKPMCLSSQDAFRLARYAEKNNSILLVGHIFRFNNAINRVKELIETKEINEVRCLELRWTTLLPPPPDRDIIFDLAPHPIDILNHLLEEWPIKVYVKAHSYQRKRIGLEEVAFVTLEFPKNIIAVVVLSWIHHGPKQRVVTLVTERNTIRIEAVKQTITLYENNRAREIPIERNNTIESEITHFVQRINHSDPPINSALIGALNVSVLESMRKSLQNNEVTPIVGG